MRILFVEDESELNELATGQLERGGHVVVSVKSVSEAQEVIDREGAQIDCVIADHRLPDGFGVAFCVQCRVRYKHIVVGVVSGCLTRKDIELMDEYAVPHWTKPVLYSQVATALEAQRIEAEESEAARKRREAPVLVGPPEPAPKRSTLSAFLQRVFKS